MGYVVCVPAAISAWSCVIEVSISEATGCWLTIIQNNRTARAEHECPPQVRVDRSGQQLRHLFPLDSWACTLKDSLDAYVYLRIQMGDRGSGSPPPAWKWQKYHEGFLAILVQIFWKITDLSSEHLMYCVGPLSARQRKGVSLPGRYWPAFKGYLDPLSLQKKNKKKWQSWTPSDKTFWIRAWKYHLL